MLVPSVPGSARADHRNLGAQTLGPEGRKNIALKVLAGGGVSEVARQNQVSRKFVYGQTSVAEKAIDAAFIKPEEEEERVLFHVAVTKTLIKQIVLVLLLRCHSSYRGVIAFFDDLFGYSISLGTIHNIVAAVTPKAECVNASIGLDRVKIGCHDEIYQGNRPVLVGVDARSTYCYLLASADHADGETWGCHLLDLMGRGFAPDAVVADLGTGLRRGQKLALPNVPCYADIFHLFRDLTDVLGPFERALDAAIKAKEVTEIKMIGMEILGKNRAGIARTLGRVAGKVSSLNELIKTLKILFDWLRDDVLTLAGPSFEERSAMYDFITSELKILETGHQKLKALRKRLTKHKEELLGFARKLDIQLSDLAIRHEVPQYLIQRLCIATGMNETDAYRYQIEGELWRVIGHRLHLLRSELEQILTATVRASSLVEMTNSILRNYFFLRRQAGAEYLKLLQFYLNHRVLTVSERSERVGRTPREVMTGQPHAHWLELLGFNRLSRCA